MENIKQIIRKINIPGAISISSLFFSWLAILMLLSNQLSLCVTFAVVAFILDSTDGFIARKLKIESRFGRQLDSLIDSINYSLLASLSIWKEILPGTLGVIVGFIVLATGILRLAGFNQEGYIIKNDVLYYRGIVTCHLSLITFIFLVLENYIQLPNLLIAMIITILAFLQLSNIKTRKTNALLFWIPVSILIVILGYICL